jgi:hypothetical protein
MSVALNDEVQMKAFAASYFELLPTFHYSAWG